MIQQKQRGRAILRKTRKFSQLFGKTQSKSERTPSLSGETLVFCEKSTGAPRFKVDLTGDREMALSRAASLLAIGCMAHGESPSDYAAWVPVENSTIERIKNLADELLHVGRAFSCPVDLSPREGEVLQELFRNRVNKEIADRLCISVRTVKFHVSSLLAKFGVGSRWDLIQKARTMLTAGEFRDEFGAPANLNGSALLAAPPKAKAELADECVVPFRSRPRSA